MKKYIVVLFIILLTASDPLSACTDDVLLPNNNVNDGNDRIYSPEMQAIAVQLSIHFGAKMAADILNIPLEKVLEWSLIQDIAAEKEEDRRNKTDRPKYVPRHSNVYPIDGSPIDLDDPDFLYPNPKDKTEVVQLTYQMSIQEVSDSLGIPYRTLQKWAFLYTEFDSPNVDNNDDYKRHDMYSLSSEKQAEAVQLARKIGISKAANQLGIIPVTLSAWITSEDKKDKGESVKTHQNKILPFPGRKNKGSVDFDLSE